MMHYFRDIGPFSDFWNTLSKFEETNMMIPIFFQDNDHNNQNKLNQVDVIIIRKFLFGWIEAVNFCANKNSIYE